MLPHLLTRKWRHPQCWHGLLRVTKEIGWVGWQLWNIEVGLHQSRYTCGWIYWQKGLEPGCSEYKVIQSRSWWIVSYFEFDSFCDDQVADERKTWINCNGGQPLGSKTSFSDLLQWIDWAITIPKGSCFMKFECCETWFAKIFQYRLQKFHWLKDEI